METILQFVKSANSIMWNSLLLIILCGTGIYYTFRLRFIQVRKFGEAFKLVFSNIKLKGAKSKKRRDEFFPGSGNCHSGSGRYR